MGPIPRATMFTCQAVLYQCIKVILARYTVMQYFRGMLIAMPSNAGVGSYALVLIQDHPVCLSRW